MLNKTVSAPPIIQSSLLPAEQAAKHLDVTVGTLAVWRSTGRYNLPFVKIGAKVRYRLEDLNAFINSRIQTHTA